MLSRIRLAYRIDMTDDGPEVVEGTPPLGFVSAVDDIAKLHDIRRGSIECRGIGRHARLKFSRDFPDKGRQAIRNAWTPPTTPGPEGGARMRG